MIHGDFMNGVILVNKEKDYTSRDIVNIFSKQFHTKKIGHTGTLDPLATGVLVIMVGEATKISELLTATYKEYIAEMIFGIKTDTLDITGTVLEDKNSILSEEKIQNTLKKMTKIYYQEVPIYSAIKVKGKKLYEYAREKEKVELPKKEVHIKKLELLNYKVENNKTIIQIKCLVSKGTYIRSLIRDIAFELNTVGTMTNLKRTKQGKFDIKDSYTIEEIKDRKFHLIPIEEALDIPSFIIKEEEIFKIKNGQIIDNIYHLPCVLLKSKVPLAIYHTYKKDQTKLKPWKMFRGE